ncbi:hypothetical protein [Paraburkholderia gardini]|nr:hypothetical protein [Paraburkholderia gardini]CAG4917925.1 hypothetical protein R69919_04566 [Paraburkholderia gardini]
MAEVVRFFGRMSSGANRAYAALRTLAMQRNMSVEDLCIALATAP